MSPTRLAALVLGTATLASTGCGGSTATVGTSNDTAANNPVQSNSATQSSASKSTVGNATDSGATSTRLVRAELAPKANAICNRVHGQLMTLTKGDTQNVALIYSRAAAYEQTALGELQKLSPPADLVGDWNQILAAMSMLTRDSAKYAQYAKAKNLNGAAHNLANSYGAIKQRAAAVAKHDGLLECALAL